MLQTLLRPGQTERVEAALTALDEHERGDPEIRATSASLRLAQHDPQAATTALAHVIDGSVGSQPFSVVAALLLGAMARDALGDPAAAGRSLERALDLAGPNSVLMAFLIHPAPVLPERHSRQRTARAVPDRRGPEPARRDEQARRAARGTAAPARARSARPRPTSCGTCLLTHRARDRQPTLRVGEHCPDAHASPVPEARRASPQRGRRAGPRARPARIFRAKALARWPRTLPGRSLRHLGKQPEAGQRGYRA